MKTIRRATFAFLFMLTAISLTACGGSGDTTLDGGGLGGDTFKAAVSKGVVTSSVAGNVVVNGISFSTAGAAGNIRIDDNPSAADLLKPGMVVTVTGSSDDAAKTGAATKIEARDALEGTIQSLGANTITVMGQTVQIEDNVTRLNDDNPAVKTFAAAAFQAGDKVEVHGFIDDNGGLRATRAVKKPDAGFEVKGFVVSTGNPFGLSLTPGGDPSIMVSGVLPNGAVPGSIVEVKATGTPSGTPLAIAAAAADIKLEDRLGAAGLKVEVEGIVRSGDFNSFSLNGQQVVTTAATLFEGGLKTDFAVGARVEAEGPIDAAGVITATKITFKSNIRIEGDITFTPGSSRLTVLGKTVVINPEPMTRFDNVTLATLATGQHVEVRALLGSDGTTLVASRIRVRSPDTKAFLQGPVTVTNGTMSILGVQIDTSVAQFRISTDAPVSQFATATEFFGALKNNVTVVKVKWDPFSTTTAAAVKEAEIQLGK